MRTVRVPSTHYPFFEVTINGVLHQFPAGKVIMVPDYIADVLDDYDEHKPKEDPDAGKPPSCDCPDGGGGGGGTVIEYEAGDNIAIIGRQINVLTADDVDPDNTRPITSAAVAASVGNIEVLLKTI